MSLLARQNIEGIEDVLANGVYYTAQRIGKGAEQYAAHVKKQPQSILTEAQAAARRTQAAVKVLWRNAHAKLLADLKNFSSGMEAMVDETDGEDTGLPRH